MKILLADDEPIARTMLEHWLNGWGYQVTPVRDGQAALDALRSDPELKLAILDWVMPKLDGLEVCRELRKDPRDRYVYVVLLTARDDKADIIAGLDAGADDYLVKPCNPLELKVRLRAGRRVIELQKQLVEAREALRSDVMNDPLTGLFNRGPLVQLLDKELLRAARNASAVAVLAMTLDDFAVDGSAGDAVLRELSRRLKACLRPYDYVGRDGRDFAVVLPGCGAKEGLAIAERVSRAVSDQPVTTDAGAITVSVNVGVSATDQFGAASGEALLRAARAAQTHAEAQGRSRWTLASTADWQAERPVESATQPAARIV